MCLMIPAPIPFETPYRPGSDAEAIREAWDEILRIGGSIKDRVVAPSTVLKKLAALPKANVLSPALREIGRVERTRRRNCSSFR